MHKDFIKLTADPKAGDAEIFYIRKSVITEITKFKGKDKSTAVTTDTGRMYVMESPEEILKMLEVTLH